MHRIYICQFSLCSRGIERGAAWSCEQLMISPGPCGRVLDDHGRRRLPSTTTFTFSLPSTTTFTFSQSTTVRPNMSKYQLERLGLPVQRQPGPNAFYPSFTSPYLVHETNPQEDLTYLPLHSRLILCVTFTPHTWPRTRGHRLFKVTEDSLNYHKPRTFLESC